MLLSNRAFTDGNEIQSQAKDGQMIDILKEDVLKRDVGKRVDFTRPSILHTLYPLQITDSHFLKCGVLKHIGDIFIHNE